MSHVVKMNMIIKDLDALEAACQECGLVLDRGKYKVGLSETELSGIEMPWKWFGRWVNDYNKDDAAYRRGIPVERYGKAPMVIRNPGNPKSYEIGVYEQDHYYVKLHPFEIDLLRIEIDKLEAVPWRLFSPGGYDPCRAQINDIKDIIASGERKVMGLNYALVFDYFAGGHGLVNKVAGAQNAAQYDKDGDNAKGDHKNCNKLTVAYAIEVAKKSPAMKGRKITMGRLPDGRYVMKATTTAGRI